VGPDSITISGSIQHNFDQLKASGAPLDTSAAALGDPTNPTQADVQKDFGAIGWTILPPPNVLADPTVREWLAMAHLPGASVVNEVLHASSPASTAPPTPPTPGGAPQNTTRRHVAHKSTEGFNGACQSSLVANDSGGVSAAASGVFCTSPAEMEGEWDWYSSVTGHQITWFDTVVGGFVLGPLFDYVWKTYLPPRVWMGDGSSSEGGAYGQRTVWWWTYTCFNSGPCGAANPLTVPNL
jgi:hypothetical protein